MNAVPKLALPKLALPKLALPPKPSPARPAAQVPQDRPPPQAHADRYPCPRCSEHFEYSVGLSAHVKEQHHSLRSHLCTQCTFSCEDDLVFRRHNRDNHYAPIAPMQSCSVLNCTFSTKNADHLARHKKHDHDAVTSHPVSTCPSCKTYSNSSVVGLSMHALHWHFEKQKCEHCEMAFEAPSDQAAHTQEMCEALQLAGEYDYTSDTLLPDHIFPDGWSMADFDVTKVYPSFAKTPSLYRDFPASIPNALLFHADPRILYQGNIIRLGENFADHDIRDRINAGRPTEIISSPQVIARRLQGAIMASANAQHLSYEEVRKTFDRKREQALLRVPQKRKRASSEDGGSAPHTPPKRARLPATLKQQASVAPSDKYDKGSDPAEMSMNPQHADFFKSQMAHREELSLEEQIDLCKPKKRANRKDNKRGATRASRQPAVSSASPAASPAKDRASQATSTNTKSTAALQPNATAASPGDNGGGNGSGAGSLGQRGEIIDLSGNDDTVASGLAAQQATGAMPVAANSPTASQSASSGIAQGASAAQPVLIE